MVPVEPMSDFPAWGAGERTRDKHHIDPNVENRFMPATSVSSALLPHSRRREPSLKLDTRQTANYWRCLMFPRLSGVKSPSAKTTDIYKQRNWLAKRGSLL